MFEAAELGLAVTDAEYAERVPGLRERLLQAQADLREEQHHEAQEQLVANWPV